AEVIAGPAVEVHLRAGAFFPRQTANIFANQLGGTRRNGLARRHSDIGTVVNEVTHRVGPDVCRCEKIPKSNSKNNGPPRMETSGRTAGPTRGWLGAHAPITPVLLPGTGVLRWMLPLSSLDPVAGLTAARPLVATGGERVQRLQRPDLAADLRPSAIGLTRPSCSAEPENACMRSRCRRA